jgi:hypothetical protein
VRLNLSESMRRKIPIPHLFIRPRGFGQTDVLVQSIITQEGTCPSSSNCKNNNPGNLIYAGQPGATAGPGGFAVFDTYQDGYNALVNQLGLYASGACGACNGQPQTLASMFQIYAPAGQGNNNPTIYAQNVANALGVDPTTSVSSILAGGSGSSSVQPDLTASFPTLDLSSLGLPDLSSIDPTVLAVGALVLGFALVMVFKK